MHPRTRSVSRIARVPATMFVVLLCASASVPQSPPVSPPSKEFASGVLGTPFYKSVDGLLRLRASFDSANPEVVIKSSYRSPAGYRKAWTTIKTAYWPTCVRELQNGVLLVAGKGRRYGNTVVEVWTFSPPAVPSVATVSQGVVPGELTDVNPVYSGNDSGRQIVREALPVWGGAPRALLQFDDSRDVYSVDIESGAIAMIASPDPARAAPHQAAVVPLLSQTDRGFAGQLADGGYVYQFSIGRAAAGIPSRVLLRDMNQDGAIELTESLTTTQWTALGYDVAAVWVQH